MPRLYIKSSFAAALPLYVASSLSFYLSPLPAHAALVQDPAPPVALDLGPAAALTAVAYTADGSTIVSADAARELRWRDAATGKTLFVKSLAQPAQDLKIAPDGSFLTSDAGDIVTWWEAPTKEAPLKKRSSFALKAPEPVVGVPVKPTNIALKWFALSPDGKTAATLMVERTEPGVRSNPVATVRLWNPDGTLRQALEAIPFEAVQPLAAFTADSKAVTVVYPDHSVKWFDTTSGQKTKEWAPPAEAAQNAADGAAERAAESDRRMAQLPQSLRDRIPANRPDRLAADLQKPERKFGTPMALSADGTQLLSGTLMGSKVWNLTTGTAQLLEQTIRLGRSEAVFSADGTRVALTGGSSVFVWDTAGPAKGRVTVPQGDITSVAFSPDSKSLLAGDDHAQARVWNMAPGSGAEPKTVLAGFFKPVEMLTAASGGMLFSTGDAMALLPPKGALQWLPAEPIKTPAQPPAQVHQNTTALAVSPDGSLLAEATYFAPYFSSLEDKGVSKGELRIRDLATNTILWRETDNGRGALSDIAWLPDNTLLLGKRGAGISIRPLPETLDGFQRRDGKTGEQLGIDVNWENRAYVDQPGGVSTIVVAADGTHVYIKAVNGLRLLDLKDKSVKGFYTSYQTASFGERNPRRYRSLVYTVSPDGHWIVGGGGGGSLNMWDMTIDRTHNEGKTLTLRAADAIDKDSAGADVLTFAKDGTLIVGFGDGSLRAYRPEWTKDAAPVWETAPTGAGIKALTLDQAGTRIWSSDARGEMKEREVATGGLRSTFRLLPAPSSAGAAAPAAGAPYAWTRWSAAGVVEKSGP